MALNINGTTGISGVDGSVSAPALTGTDSNTGIIFPAADTIKFATGGVERMSITNSGITGVSTTEAAATPNVGGSGNVHHAVLNNITYGSSVSGAQLLGNVQGSLSASTVYAVEVYVQAVHNASSASHGYLTGWYYQTGKTYNVDGYYLAINIYNQYYVSLPFTFILPWDPSGTQSLSLYVTGALNTDTNNYFNVGINNKLENV